jgi:SAM-dependent methyltransferase
MGIDLLPRASLRNTGPVDHADWNYHGLLGKIQRRRFSIFMSLLPRQPIHRLLEIGYGSGVFLPELSHHCEELYGIDIHQNHPEVARILREQGINARLFSGSATELPFEDGSFDCVAAISVLEFIPDLEAACREVRRILKPDGFFIVVTPGKALLLDVGLFLLTGKKAKNDFLIRGRPLLEVLCRLFRIERQISFPNKTPLRWRLYTGMALKPRQAYNAPTKH